MELQPDAGTIRPPRHGAALGRHDNDELVVMMYFFDVGTLEATYSFSTVTFPG